MTLAQTLRSDYRVNPSPQSRMTVTVFRLDQATRTGWWRALRPLTGLAHAGWIRFLMGAEIPRALTVGPGFAIRHGGRGVFIHPDVVIGVNVTLHLQVAIGVRREGGPVPRIGDGVTIGARASVFGDVTVGAGAMVGAHSLVISDVPAAAVVAGVPARSLRSRSSS